VGPSRPWSETTDLALTGSEQAFLQASLEERAVRFQAEAGRQAQSNAAMATVAQGEAVVQADLAATRAVEAAESAVEILFDHSNREKLQKADRAHEETFTLSQSPP
jgi:hypothetical protein